MKNLKVLFMGTPEFALPSLTSLYENCDVVGVVCQPDKPSNRGQLIYSPIKKYAISNNIKLFQPQKIKDEYANILETKPDIIITCAYGQMLPLDFINFPLYGCINIHASLLPKLRGGAPIQRAIMDGYSKTGITIMRTVMKMDAGDILSQVEIPILETDTAGTIHDKLSLLGRDLLLETLPKILDKTINPIKQNEEEVTYAWTLKREDERINFNKLSREIFNQVRGLNPFPGAYTMLNGKIIKIWRIEIGDSHPSEEYINGQITSIYDDGIGVKVGNGEIIIKELQLEGRKKMEASEFLNGAVNKDLLEERIFE